MTNHLVQSTLFAAGAALLAFALRNNAARVRHWIWLAASMKFLVPFSLLVGLGGQVHWHNTAPPHLSYVMEHDSESLPTPEVRFAPASSAIDWPKLGAAAWLCGCAIVLISWFVRWWRVRAAVRAASSIGLKHGIQVLSTPALLEPGVFGIRRPVLLLPQGIAERLTEEQLDTIVAHELCHIRRRDNLAAALHMIVEAVFWFHPLVWWIGARLVEERERACDEEVLRLGNEPEVYAESILKICRLYLESPLECVSGVTGSDLKKRVENIMRHRTARQLGLARKLFLAGAACAAIAGPVAVGIWNAPPLHAQSHTERLAFEVASVKPTPKDAPNSGIGLEFAANGRMSARGVPLLFLVAMAYNLPFQGPRLTGMSKELASERYDIDATAEAGAIPPGATKLVREAKMKLMLQTLLEDRFKMKIQHETKDLPIYAVVIAKNGPKLKKSKFEEKDCSDAPGDKKVDCHDFQGGMGRGLHSQAINMSDLAQAVSNWADRPVVDRTGLEGLFEIDTEGWAPMRARGPDENESETRTMNDPTRATIFMIFDRLGLKLESSKGPVDMYVIEHMEKPTEN